MQVRAEFVSVVEEFEDLGCAQIPDGDEVTLDVFGHQRPHHAEECAS